MEVTVQEQHTRAPAAAPTASDQLSVTEAYERVHDGALLLDVRESYEFAQTCAVGAVNLPLSELEARYTELDADRPIAVICRSGNRSDLAAGFLRQAGFDAANVVGGMIAWQREDLPLATTAPRT
jgi:rhodanese-related sulfurtransferase